jgi:hypothetical protein
MIKYILGILTITIIGLLYHQIEKKYLEKQHYDLVSKYLIKGKPDTTKPILWIYIPEDNNARSWKNWGSRNTKDINIPYIQWTIESIIQKAGDDFNIYFLQNDSFSLLLPNWNIQLEKLADPEKEHMTQFALLQVLYKYGGVLTPMSFIALRPIIELYNYGMTNNDMFFVQPSSFFLGCTSECKQMERILQELQQLFSSHHTEYTKVKYHDILYRNTIQIPEQLLGTRDIHNNEIHLDMMMKEEPIALHKDIFGLVIPTKKILRSTKYQWFAYLHTQDVLLVDNSFSKLLVKSK